MDIRRQSKSTAASSGEASTSGEGPLIIEEYCEWVVFFLEESSLIVI
jgi:hypothetical protein